MAGKIDRIVIFQPQAACSLATTTAGGLWERKGVKMACKICGRPFCTECFHSIEAQEEFEQREKEQNIEEYIEETER